MEGDGAGVEAARSVEGGGVIMLSMGSTLVGTSKRDGYMSPGVERKDSAGESSNLTVGAG